MFVCFVLCSLCLCAIKRQIYSALFTLRNDGEWHNAHSSLIGFSINVFTTCYTIFTDDAPEGCFGFLASFSCETGSGIYLFGSIWIRFSSSYLKMNCLILTVYNWLYPYLFAL